MEPGLYREQGRAAKCQIGLSMAGRVGSSSSMCRRCSLDWPGPANQTRPCRPIADRVSEWAVDLVACLGIIWRLWIVACWESSSCHVQFGFRGESCTRQHGAGLALVVLIRRRRTTGSILVSSRRPSSHQPHVSDFFTCVLLACRSAHRLF